MSPALMSSISDWIFKAHRWACHTYTTAGSVRLFRCIVTKQAITGIGITLSQVSYSLRHLLSLSHTHKHIPTTKQCLCIYKFIYNDINSQTISLSLSNNTHTLSVPPPPPPISPSLTHTHKNNTTTLTHTHTHTHIWLSRHTHTCVHTHECTNSFSRCDWYPLLKHILYQLMEHQVALHWIIQVDVWFNEQTFLKTER